MTNLSATIPPAAFAARTPRATTICAHCGLDVPPGLVAPAAERNFCCSGCETAWSVISSCGLERFYRLRDQDAAPRAPARSGAGRYDHFDDASFRRLYARRQPSGLLSAELSLEGVHCAACVWLLERLPVVAPGVVESRLDFRRAIVRVTWNEDRIALSRIARTLESLGYPPHPAREASARDRRRTEDRRFLIRIAVAGALAGNVMLLALALYAGAFAGMEERFAGLFRWLSMGLGCISLAWPGAVFFRSAIGSLRARALNLDVPIALALLAGGISGGVNTLRGAGEIYFDSLSMLVFLLLVGRFIHLRRQRSAFDAVELLYALTPSSARRVEADGPRDVPVEALFPGDTIEVRAGESLPADGEIITGASEIDQSLLSGESRPQRVSAGDRVAAGAVNLSAMLRVRVSATGESTRVGRLMRLVAEGAERRAPVVRMADRVARWFVAGVLALAALTAGVWLLVDPARAFDHAAAMLIVTCPCALGLATPMAMAIASGRAARRSILIKGADALEQLARPGALLLDKTGTITEGRRTVVRWAGDESARPLVAALESHSSHPAARALAAVAPDAAPRAVENVSQIVGAGIAGFVEGRSVAVGSRAFIESRAGAIPPWAIRAADRMAADALSPVSVAVDGRVVAVAGLGDPVRPEARGAIARLRARGWIVRILSGDDADVVRAVGRSLGLDDDACRGGASPEDKLAVVQSLSRSGPVVMVGDGVNDAAALSAATVGVAVHGGAEASLAAADVYMARPGLAPLVELTDAARRTMRAIRICLGASLLYNIVAAGLALSGQITPLLAAALMPLSSFTVLTIVVRSRTFEREGETCP